MDNQQSSIKNSETEIPPNQKGIVWIIVNILLREGAIMVPLCFILMMILVAVMENMGITQQNIMQKALANNQLLENIEMAYGLIGLILAFISYIGIRWGCKYVSKKTRINSKDYIKIGWWVVIVTTAILYAVDSYLAGAVAILGLLLTMTLIKKWLTKFQSQFQVRG